jgi:putative aldouronate transport system substrate-binding protein
MKKKLALFLVCFVALSLFAVYGAGRQSGQSQASAEKPEISITAFDRGQIPASEGSYENNRWTRWINENSPVKVNWVPILRNESWARINALFAAGTAPDVVWEYGKDFMDNLLVQEVIQPVGDYIEKYSTEYKAYQAKYPIMMPYLTGDDGQQYGISSYGGKDMPNQIWIRKDWLDKFGMTAPTTIEEALTFMRRVRDEDPDGNGIKDTWGLVFNNMYTLTIATCFGAPYPDGIFDVQNGHYVDWGTSPGHRAYLDFMAMCYREGLIDPEYITDTQNTRHRQLLVSGKAGIYVGSTGLANEYRELKQNSPNAELLPVAPFKTSFGSFDYHFARAGVRKILCINKNSKNAESIMKFADWQISGGWRTTDYGLEGRHYQLVNGVPVVINAELNKQERDYAGDYTLLADFIKPLEWIKLEAAPDPVSQAFADIEIALKRRQLEGKPKAFVPYPYSSETVNAYNTTTNTQISAIEASIITGKTTVDEGIRQINNVKNAAGVNKVTAEKDAWYQKNKALFESLSGLF